METKHTLHICMGSACHQLGIFEVLPRLQQLIQEYDLEEQIEIKGAFCLGVCARGTVIKLDDTFIVDVNIHNVEGKFINEVMTRLEGTVSQ
jgi:NADH:ubiquinone oxidoreductase subunit E